MCRYVLHDEVAVGSDQGRVVVAGVGVGPTEAHEHAWRGTGEASARDRRYTRRERRRQEGGGRWW